MFGIGSTELLVILVVALIVLGPKSLAGVSRSLGKAMGEFRRASTDFQRALNVEVAQEDLKEREKKRAAAASPTTPETAVNLSKDNPPVASDEVTESPDTLAAFPEDSPVSQAIKKAAQDAAPGANPTLPPNNESHV